MVRLGRLAQEIANELLDIVRCGIMSRPRVNKKFLYQAGFSQDFFNFVAVSHGEIDQILLPYNYEPAAVAV